MKILVIGGTGLLGSEAVKVLSAGGHELSVLAKDAQQLGHLLPPDTKLLEYDLYGLDETELAALLQGQEAVIFAAGIDERLSAKAPIIELFRKYNNEILRKILRVIPAAGVKQLVVCGSYFTYFNRRMPEFQLAEKHPYIRSRLEQLQLCLAADNGCENVAVLELPYIFGVQEGRKPVWVFLVEMLRKMPLATYFPKGGTAMLTARQVGRALADAALNNRGKHAYPVAAANLCWKEMLSLMHRGMGQAKRKVITIPDSWFRIGTYFVRAKQRRQGIEGGLDLPAFSPFMCKEAFIPLDEVKLDLGEDDIAAAIIASTAQSLAYIKGETMVEMRA